MSVMVQSFYSDLTLDGSSVMVVGLLFIGELSCSAVLSRQHSLSNRGYMHEVSHKQLKDLQILCHHFSVLQDFFFYMNMLCSIAICNKPTTDRPHLTTFEHSFFITVSCLHEAQDPV